VGRAPGAQVIEEQDITLVVELISDELRLEILPLQNGVVDAQFIREVDELGRRLVCTRSSGVETAAGCIGVRGDQLVFLRRVL
jgi:hypothetical protein